MRIRQVRQDFWSDEKVARMPDNVRLFYIGLWCVADDLGWFRWDAARIGALLYPFRTGNRRVKDVNAWAHVLITEGRLLIHSCGCAVIPTLPRHQVIGGKKSEGEYRRHLTVCLGSPGHPGSPESPGGRVGNGKERNVTVARAGEPDGPRGETEWDRKVAESIARGPIQ